MSESTMMIDENGNKEWRNESGELHRLDGPAYEGFDGEKLWCKNGFFHRLDGPAVEWSDGSKMWFQNDLRHRLDGPAFEYKNRNDWYFNNEFLGSGIKGFLGLWNLLNETQRQNVNLHMWLARLKNN